MPKIAEIEPTPNPNARKFVLREPLTYGVTRSYESAEQTQDDPLASALFAIPHVTNVFYVDHWVTVTQDGRADWSDLLRQVAVPIREAPAAAARAAEMLEQTVGEGAAWEEDLSAEDSEKLSTVRALLDERVRPYLRGDGGDVYVVGLEGKLLKVHYQGACGSCPSSLSGTLSAIEYLVREVDPDFEVMPV
jgi:Fe-S cluster biogenesis protein NfuA